ncbi:F-actin-uncapping protein LRRC16A-like [Xyrauchen texanus]|uniref:F-actin-uncapping protein LRRC16A-like n=1 Tax=Xyrauchen texanus TaxID=154827 RepID=UPI002241E62F|nr:F-actin-uncapping protein LRRC16A-like [Xyrauchen texanus]
MSSDESDIPGGLLESVQDAVGQQVKLCAVKKVNLEVKGDKLGVRILALAAHRVFLLTARVPVKVELSFSVFDIQCISSVKQNQLLLDYDRGQLSVRLTSDQETDGVIALIGTNIKEICPGLNPLRVIKRLILKPVERTISLQTLWENHNTTEAGPCGGFSRLYWCVCDQLGVPYRDEVQWDVDTIYLSQDTRDLCLQDFIHLDNRDLMAIIAALEFNHWFIKLSIKDFKLTADLCDQILRVVSRSTILEQLTLDNTGLKSDFALKFAGALSQNPHSALHTINLANNSLEDKGVAALSSSLCKLTPGLKHLDLSKNSLTIKGVNILALCFCSNPSIYNTLTHLNLSGNALKGDDMPNMWSFLGQPNSLHTLDMSNSDCSLDLVCSSLLRGSLKHLSVLNMSRSVFRKSKEFPSSFKQFFSCSVSLKTVCLSGTRLPAEGLKALLLGLACNSNLRDVSLDISSCELRSTGSQILEGCIAEIPNITSLDISDNGLDSDLSTLLMWLSKNRSIKHLSIGKNFNNIKMKNLGQVLVALIHMIQEEESPLSSLSLADSRLKADLSVFLNAVGSNSSLTHLDISGNNMGDFGAKMLAKALQINTKLRTVIWDRNCVSVQGLQDVAAALEKNYTIRFMPVPITDAAQALKNNPEKTEDVLMKMEQYLLRNHESRRYLREQAFRLHQGIMTSTTQQLMGQVCVQVQDKLNSLRFSASDRVQQDMKTAEKLMTDAKNSRTLLSSLYHLRSDGRVAGVSDGSEAVCVRQVHEKLSLVAGEISAVIDKQLQSMLLSMLDTAASVCPHMMQKASLRDLLHTTEGKMSVTQAFITSTLLEQSAIDIINKISEVKFSMASCLSDYITDEILQSLSHSQHTLAAHLSRQAHQPLLDHDSHETEVLDETEMHTHNLIQAEPEVTHRNKRKTVYSQMFRPMSSAFELGFDLCKALEDMSTHVYDLAPPPSLTPPPPMSPLLPMTPVEVEPEQPLAVHFNELISVDTPSLQHVTKYRPRRTKKAKPSRAAPIRKDSSQEVDPSIIVDEGLQEFYYKKVNNIGPKSSVVDAEKKRESRISGFFDLIKHRSSTKTTSTTPSATATTTPTETNAQPPKLVVTLNDPVPEHVAPEVRGHVQEGVKHDSPLMGRHMGVQVLGSDLLAEIRAKQEKRKKDKVIVSPTVTVQSELHDEGGTTKHTSSALQKHTRTEHTVQFVTSKHTHEYTPEHTHTSSKQDSRHPSTCSDVISSGPTAVLQSNRTISPPPLEIITEFSTGDSSPTLPAPPPSQWVVLSDTESPVTHSSKGGDSPDISLGSPADVFETDSHTLTIERSISCVQSRPDPTDDSTDRQRTKSLPTADVTNHIS